MKIIAQKSDAMNSEEFFRKALSTNYIDGINLNVALTRDNQIVVFNNTSVSDAIVNTIDNSTLSELNNYDIITLEDTLNKLNQKNTTKDIYINVIPFKTGILTDENIQQTVTKMNLYIDTLKTIIDNFTRLTIHVHSINRNLVSMLKNKLKNNQVGFVIYTGDLNFIDVDYYVFTMNVYDEAIIDQLLRKNKNILIYIHSDYYLSVVYQGFLKEQENKVITKLVDKIAIISNYPEIIYKLFKT